MTTGAQKRRLSVDQLASWGVLCALLLAVLVGAATFERNTWPALVGDEATYLMAGSSLAWDHDLRYNRVDFDRFIQNWAHFPEGLILQSGNGGETLNFGKPLFYPLYIAPFMRLQPVRGPFIANALLLILTALIAARALEPRLGTQAPLWVALFLFCSVAFAQVFWAHSDLFLMCLCAIALSLATDPRTREDSRLERVMRWLLVGTLLAIVVFSRPFYLPLLGAAAFALPRLRSRRALAFVAGAMIVFVVAAGATRARTGSWTSYGGERRAFYNHTGFPEVDFPSREWGRALEESGNAAWGEATNILGVRVDPRLFGWNSVYFLAGRHVGVLPYFLPLLLGFAVRPRGARRWALLAAAAMAVTAFFVFRPFNFWGGGSSLANRYFLPVYPAFWFLASRPLPRLVPLGVAVLAGVFLWPLWSAPRSFPLTEERGYRWVSSTAHRMLPYETTQSHLKPGGRDDVTFNGLWIKFLDSGARPIQGEQLLLVDAVGARLLVGTAAPIEKLEARFSEGAENDFTLGGGVVGPVRVDGDSPVLSLEPPALKAKHPMWWQWEPYHLYEVKVGTAADTPIRFELRNVGGAE